LLFAGLLIAAAGCGGSSGGGVTAQTVVTTTAAGNRTGNTDAGSSDSVATGATSPPATKAKKGVGTVDGIVPVGGTVGGERAFEGQALAAQDVVATEPNGKVIFSVAKLVPFCQVETDSAVQVLPAGGTLVTVQRGTALCRTSATGQLKQFAAGGVAVTASDPVVLLGWDGETATVRVAQGYVKIQGNGRSAIVGPNQQATSGGGRTGVGPWDPASIDDAQTRRAATAQVAAAVSSQARTRYPGLNSSSSPTLRAAQARGVLVIGVDDEAITTFVQELFGEMGRLWKVTVSTQQGTDPAQGRDIVVTSRPQRSDAVVLADIDGTTYYAETVQADKAMTSAVAGFLSSSLRADCPSRGAGGAEPGASCYEDIYKVQLGADFVPLDPLARYLGLG
jgi:hypothetical protein